MSLIYIDYYVKLMLTSKGPLIRLGHGRQAMTRNKDLEDAEAKIEALEEKLVTTEKDLEEARADLVMVTDQKERGINVYMQTTEFKELMEDHDALTHPISVKEGRDDAIKAILMAHPGTFEASAFACPLVPQPSKAVVAKDSRLLREGESDDSDDSSSSESEEAKMTTQKKTPNPSSKSSSEGNSEESSCES